MTAQPKTFSSKTTWTITAIVIVILAALGGYTFYTRSRSTNASFTTSANNQTSVARRGDLIVSATGQGTLIAQTTATFGFKTGAAVTAVNVKIGDQVQAGQVLAQVDETLQQMKYAEAQQALQELYSAASIANVEKEIATAQDTEFQARTWLSYLISPAVVDAEENLAAAQQKLADAQAEAKAAPSTAADQKVKQAQASVTYLQGVLDQAWATYKNVYGPDNFTEYTRVGRGPGSHQVAVTTTDPITGKEIPKIDWPSEADITTARSNYAQAKQTIKDDQAYLQTLNTGVIPEGATGALYTTLYQAQLAVTNAQADLDKTKLIAPINGTVTALDINLGQQANTTSAITIAQLAQPYTLDAYIGENDWYSAKLGNDVNVTFNLLPNKSFPGIVTMVYPNLATSGEEPLIHILVQLNQNISQVLPAGTGASLTVVGGEANNAILLPANMVHQTNAGTYEVYVVQNGQKIKKQVEVGLRGTAYVEIKSGLDAGEIVTAQ